MSVSTRFESSRSTKIGSFAPRDYGLLFVLAVDLDFSVQDEFTQTVCQSILEQKPSSVVLSLARRFVDLRGFTAIEVVANTCVTASSRLFVAEPSWSLRYLWESLKPRAPMALCEHLEGAEDAAGAPEEV